MYTYYIEVTWSSANTITVNQVIQSPSTNGPYQTQEGKQKTSSIFTHSNLLTNLEMWFFLSTKMGEITEGFENDLPTFQNVQFPTISINSPSMLGFPRNSFDSCISISHFNKISSKCTNPYFSKPTNPDFLSRHHNLTANLFYWIITRQNFKCNFAISNTCTTLWTNKNQNKISRSISSACFWQTPHLPIYDPSLCPGSLW